MKCKFCGKKTTWDESFGTKNLIMCSECMEKYGNQINKIIKTSKDNVIRDNGIVLMMLLECGKAASK